MAKKTPVRSTSIDPAVEELLREMEQRQAESQLPRREREKKARERQKIAARRERRATYDLPPEIRARMMELSTQLSIPASQLVTLALMRFLDDYDRGNLDLSVWKHPSHSPRYDWNLVFPDDVSKRTISKKDDGRSSRSIKVVKK